MAVTDTFLQERITATQTAIEAYEAAALAFANDGNMQSYKLDTGQSVQNVTRAELGSIGRTIDNLYNRLATLTARKDGAASVGRPAW